MADIIRSIEEIIGALGGKNLKGEPAPFPTNAEVRYAIKFYRELGECMRECPLYRGVAGIAYIQQNTFENIQAAWELEEIRVKGKPFTLSADLPAFTS